MASDRETILKKSSTLESSSWIVIPAYNEDESLPRVLREIQSHGRTENGSEPKLDYTIVVIDDCSAVPITQLDLPEGVFVLRHLINLGQGAALQTGISFALSRGASEIVTFDSDGQHCVEDIHRLVEPVSSGKYDVCLGTRFASGGSAVGIPLFRFYFLKLAVLFTRLTTGLALTDTHNGFRCFSRSAASQISITQNRMSHGSQILSEIKRCHLNFLEVPVTIRYTSYSLNKGQRLSNAFNIVWESTMELLRR